jgi:glyoxalase family protein
MSHTDAKPILGLHHVTSIARGAQQNLDFYSGVLGLRLVKKTVNFDDPSVYHLYYGDQGGNPGSILTFFPWAHSRRGEPGVGQTSATTFRVAPEAIPFWRERLAGLGVEASEGERFGEAYLRFHDGDGTAIELIGAGGEPDVSGAFGDSSIHGFDGVTLTLKDAGPTAELLQLFGYSPAGTDGRRQRFAAAGGPAARIDLVVEPDGRQGRIAAGSVHHVAFRVRDDADQLAWQAKLGAAGHWPTEVKDRQYFHSIYFREPGGVLFELATDPPGFTFDETREELGSGLKLPSWLEASRARIEASLEPLVNVAATPAGVAS